MDRKQFLGSIFALAALQALPKSLTQTSSKNELWIIGMDPYANDLPGIDGKAFTVILNKKWYNDGDLIMVTKYRNYFKYSIDEKNEHWITEVVEDKRKVPLLFHVKDFNTKQQEENFIEKLGNVYKDLQIAEIK